MCVAKTDRHTGWQHQWILHQTFMYDALHPHMSFTSSTIFAFLCWVILNGKLRARFSFLFSFVNLIAFYWVLSSFSTTHHTQHVAECRKWFLLLLHFYTHAIFTIHMFVCQTVWLVFLYVYSHLQSVLSESSYVLRYLSCIENFL